MYNCTFFKILIVPVHSSLSFAKFVPSRIYLSPFMVPVDSHGKKFTLSFLDGVSSPFFFCDFLVPPFFPLDFFANPPQITLPLEMKSEETWRPSLHLSFPFR